jgi:hypothetical protein
MRNVKLALIASTAIVAFSASAWAITVKKRIEAPGAPAEVWVVAGETFCTIKTWHPAVAECEEATEGEDVYRTLTLKDGAKIKEKLTGKDDLSYSYVITESPLPVKNYSSKLWVEEDDEPDRTVIFWQSEFEPADGKTEEEAKKVITGVLADGVKGIKKNAIAAWDEKHPEDAPDDDDDDDKE